MKILMKFSLLLALGLCGCVSHPALQRTAHFYPIQKGWARNSINAVIFRKNSLVTHNGKQYAAFYDADGSVLLARRSLGSAAWEVRKTDLKGDLNDAHNSISIMLDGDGYLHLAWNHHDTPLNYCRSLEPESLELGEPEAMTGHRENKVSYPEFYRLPDGNLIFMYRDGSSGMGNMLLDYYDTATRSWTQRQENLISGQSQRSAYWQAIVDEQGTIHISWVWRESWDVATNHDLCYAQSTDGGLTWQEVSGIPYELPITADTAEYACRIPQGSELINQTSMCTDPQGRPLIATYWRPEGTEVPQYHVVYYDGDFWQTSQVTHRTTPFSLSGGGTKRIPISRPQIVADADGAYMIYRDEELGNQISLAYCSDPASGPWRTIQLSEEPVGQWEPTYDTELWAQSHVLALYMQYVGQGDAENLEDLPPQMAGVLEW